MGKNFDTLDLQTLLDLLAEATENYTKALVNNGSPHELDENKRLMNQLLLEIKKRKHENPGTDS
jgi:hypothetical protein